MAQSTKTTGQAKPRGILERLDLARAELASDHSPENLDAVLSDLSIRVRTVLSEHKGMADELLSVYEQLGIIFEVTQKLPTARDSVQILQLFADSLRASFKGNRVHVAYPLPAGGYTTDDRYERISGWLSSLIDRSARSKSVFAEEPPEGSGLESVHQVMVGPLYCGGDFVASIVLQRDRGSRKYRACDMLLMESLTQFCSDLIRNQHLLTELKETLMAMVRSLVSTVDQKDPYTSGHSVRVGYFAMLLARERGLSYDELQMLEWSALLHDIGKIGIRDDVLNKQGKLNDEERRHIMEHPTRSCEVLKQIPQLADAIDGVLYHHEHWDGGGYPDGLCAEEIPLQARIIQVADIFDALTSDRSYRAAFSWEKALGILKEESGTTVDPVLQGAFDRMMRRLLAGDPSNWATLVTRAERFEAGGRRLQTVR